MTSDKKQHPPRVWIEKFKIKGLNYQRLDKACLGASLTPPKNPEAYPAEEYLSLSEANALADEREARARREAFEESAYNVAEILDELNHSLGFEHLCEVVREVSQYLIIRAKQSVVESQAGSGEQEGGGE